MYIQLFVAIIQVTLCSWSPVKNWRIL